MTIEQHEPFGAYDSTELPWWMPVSEAGPDWVFRRSGEFKQLPDPALLHVEEES